MVTMVMILKENVVIVMLAVKLVLEHIVMIVKLVLKEFIYIAMIKVIVVVLNHVHSDSGVMMLLMNVPIVTLLVVLVLVVNIITVSVVHPMLLLIMENVS